MKVFLAQMESSLSEAIIMVEPGGLSMMELGGKAWWVKHGGVGW